MLSPEQELVSDQLRALWRRVEAHELSWEQYEAERLGLLDRYREIWEHALVLEGHSSLKDSLVAELDLYAGRGDVSETETRCRQAATVLMHEWRERVIEGDRASIEAFYNENVTCIYDLMWWHNLDVDDDPLAYVLALHLASRRGCHRCLDFGAGVGSGSILLARHGMEVTSADISSVMLAFTGWRFELRDLPVKLIDTKVDPLPANSFQLVTAMDSLEHLVDPVETVETLWECLEPSGLLIGRFHMKPGDYRPQHIVRDFAPTLQRMAELGFVEIWRDEWLWGHQAFEKR